MKYIVKNSATNNLQPVVLIAPLDWGLGHATRCIPLIRYMLTLNYRVILAGEGAQIALLQQEFPQLSCVFLRGYRLKYASSGWMTTIKIILQIPKILISIKREQHWLNDFLKKNQVAAVISDNRYGLFHADIPAVFITHQLSIKTLNGGAGEKILQKINYRFINRFSECWVPDLAGPVNLAGELSHPRSLPVVPVKYLGPLSRLQYLAAEPAYDVMIILSGPEPQRTLLENICLRELRDYKGPVIMVRGLPGTQQPLAGFNRIAIFNHLPSAEMTDAINRSGIIVSRSGYSTVMDLMTLRKKCIFIPTPGQPEQSYLAKYLGSRNHCLYYRQQAFSLSEALNTIRAKPLTPFSYIPEHGYQQALTDLLR